MKSASRQMRKLYAAILLSLTSALAHATHMSGGEIYWEHLGGNQYRITLTIYRDCAGIQLDNDYDLDITSPCGNHTLNVTTPGGVELSQLCDLQLPNSTCNGGNLPGIQEYVYTGVINLPPCDSWTISWTEIYRNNAIVNLQAPGTLEMYIEGVLNNAEGPANDSPQFTNTAIPYICLGYPVSYSYGAFDPEGDSLSYEFIGARVGGANPIAYVPPFTGASPITGITLDPATGLVNFTLNQAGNWVVVVRVNEYDSLGNLIGTIMRDMQFVAYPCSNVPPDPTTGTVGGMSGGAVQTAPYAVQVCESGDFCFDMVIADPNANNVLEATSNISNNLPGATFSFTGTNPITCHVCWNAGPGTAGFYPFIVNVNDGACPITAFQTYVYSITVIEGLFIDVTTTNESCTGAGDGNATVNVLAGTGPYQYNWGTIGANTPSITAGAGTYPLQVTDANGCVAAPEQVVIGTTPAPMANAGNDLVVCAGAWPIALNGTGTNAQSLTWTGGSGSFTGSGGNAQYTPSAAEIAAGGTDLTLTAAGNGACPDATDVVHISISYTFLNATVTATDASCNGVANGSADFTPNTTGITYVWNTIPVQTTATATGLGAGTYSVTATDALGCPHTEQVVIDQPAALTVASITPQPESCAGAANGSITVVVSGGTAPYTYDWSNGGDAATISAGAGTYTVQVSDANGCAPVNASATIVASAQPNVANAGADIIACSNDLPVQLNGNVVNASGGTWSGVGSFSGVGLSPAYTPSVAEVLAGSATLILTTTGNTACPADADTVAITIGNSFLNSTVSSTAALCAGQGTGTAAYTPLLPGVSYQWNAPGQPTTPSISGLFSGTYTVTVIDLLGCDTTLSVTITEPAALTIPSVQSVNPLCAGQANGTATANVSGGTPIYEFLWSANSGSQTTQTATGLVGGSYLVTVTDANGCTAQGSATITAPAPITLQAQVPDTVCVNTPAVLTAQASGGDGNLTIDWSGIGTGTSLTYSFPASQVITITVSDGLGCAGPVLSFPVHVLDLTQASLVTFGDTTVCAGGVSNVSAQLLGYAGPVTWNWPSLGALSAGPHTVNINSTQTQNVIVSNTCGQSLNGSVLLVLETPPNIVLPNIIGQGCAPLTVQFPDSLTTENVTWLWNLGDGNTSTAPAPVYTYPAGDFTISLVVTTPAGCSAAALNTGVVNAYAPPTAAFTASSYTMDMSQPTVEFTDESVGDINSYAWDFGDGGTSTTDDPSYTYNDVGVFTVQLQVTDIHGCTSDAATTITTTPVYDITIPNAFTPDIGGGNGGVYDPNDLNNDVFYPFVRFVKDFKMRIWNRWGELVFESEDVRRGWDGYYRGVLSQQDVYVYRMDIVFVDDRRVERSGDITLFR